MSKKVFNEWEMNELESNPNVRKVSERSISYQPDFKLRAVKENLTGKGPTQLFIKNGFDPNMISRSKPKECLKRWRKMIS